MKNNRFIIMVASYNNEDWAEYNIVSILNQTYTNYHVYYVDDCSTDKTNQIVTELVKDNDRFTIIRNETNLGADALPYTITLGFSILWKTMRYVCKCLEMIGCLTKTFSKS